MSTQTPEKTQTQKINLLSLIEDAEAEISTASNGMERRLEIIEELSNMDNSFRENIGVIKKEKQSPEELFANEIISQEECGFLTKGREKIKEAEEKNLSQSEKIVAIKNAITEIENSIEERKNDLLEEKTKSYHDSTKILNREMEKIESNEVVFSGIYEEALKEDVSREEKKEEAKKEALKILKDCHSKMRSLIDTNKYCTILINQITDCDCAELLSEKNDAVKKKNIAMIRRTLSKAIIESEKTYTQKDLIPWRRSEKYSEDANFFLSNINIIKDLNEMVRRDDEEISQKASSLLEKINKFREMNKNARELIGKYKIPGKDELTEIYKAFETRKNNNKNFKTEEIVKARRAVDEKIETLRKQENFHDISLGDGIAIIIEKANNKNGDVIFRVVENYGINQDKNYIKGTTWTEKTLPAKLRKKLIWE